MQNSLFREVLKEVLIEIFEEETSKSGRTKSGKKITCSECGWKWNTKESAKSDMYVCHKCGHDNKPNK